MTEIIFIVDETTEGVYEARALDHSRFTDGGNMPELKENIREAIQCHFDIAKDELLDQI